MRFWVAEVGDGDEDEESFAAVELALFSTVFDASAAAAPASSACRRPAPLVMAEVPPVVVVPVLM